MIEVGQGRVVLLCPYIRKEELLPEYYKKDKHSNYVVYENTKELQNLVNKYIEVNG